MVVAPLMENRRLHQRQKPADAIGFTGVGVSLGILSRNAPSFVPTQSRPAVFVSADGSIRTVFPTTVKKQDLIVKTRALICWFIVLQEAGIRKERTDYANHSSCR